jgi:hypothetical protein
MKASCKLLRRESNSAVAKNAHQAKNWPDSTASEEEVEQFTLRTKFIKRFSCVPTEGKNNQRKIQQDSDSNY